MDLFEYARELNKDKESPLAGRMRPATLDEVVGQEHIIGKDKLLYRAIKADKISSIIFYGPPGTGKTTLAKVIANTTKANFVQMNATTSGKKDMQEAGLDMVFVQDNQSSSTKGVLRGLHFQKEFPQGKLVRVVKGSVFDVAVDLRSDSETYGKWFGVELTEENKKQFYIPEGFAHGFLVLSDLAEFCYKCTDFYHPGDEGGLAWNDPEIGIKWPQLVGEYKGTASGEGYKLEDGTALNLSDKDQLWVGLKDTFKF